MKTLNELKKEIEKLNNKPFNHNAKKWQQEFFEVSGGVYICKTKDKDYFFWHTNDGYSGYYTTEELIKDAFEMEWVEEEEENEKDPEEILKESIVKKIMQKIDDLKPVSLTNIVEDETDESYNIHSDYYVYKAKTEDKYYFYSVIDEDIELISREELSRIIYNNWNIIGLKPIKLK